MAKKHRTTAVVIATTATKATVQLSHADEVNCQQCQQHGGCQSLSLSHWFFATSSAYLPQPATPDSPYRIGEKLTLAFPSSLLQWVLVSLLGLPLLGFLFGIALSTRLGEVASFSLATIFACTIFYLSKPSIIKVATRKIHVFRQS